MRALYTFTLMQILEQTEVGYTYIGNDHNYYAVIDNSAINCMDDVYPMQLGPWHPFDPEFELPF